MRKLLLILLFSTAACGSSTEPPGSAAALLTNDLPADPVYLSWYDAHSALIRTDTIPAKTVFCSRLSAQQPDSAYYRFVATNSLSTASGRTNAMTGSWFKPADRPKFKLIVFAASGSGNVGVQSWPADPGTDC
jgi:hypothetical protein